MDYAESLGFHAAIELSGGRQILMESLQQKRTYAGLLLGTPSADTNEGDIAYALNHAESLPDSVGKAVLIPPARRDFFKTPGDMDDVIERQRDRPEEMQRMPEWLPNIRCTAVFSHDQPVRDQSQDMSCLTIVWYQDEFALPISDAALTAIRNLDWSQLATDTGL